MKNENALGPISILLVDDEEDVLNFLSEYLRDQGLVVKTAGNGEDAINALEGSDEIDVVVTDILMPKMDGIQLSKLIHEKVPVVMMSALSAEEFGDDIIDLNDAYIEKYRSKDDLKRAALKAIERWNSENGLDFEIAA